MSAPELPKETLTVGQYHLGKYLTNAAVCECLRLASFNGFRDTAGPLSVLEGTP
jgi:hypothetical protein